MEMIRLATSPSLRERIKTAYDNRKYRGRNVVLTSLNYDVAKRVDRTRVSSLLDTEKLITKTIAVVILAFILLTINFIGFDFRNDYNLVIKFFLIILLFVY